MLRYSKNAPPPYSPLSPPPATMMGKSVVSFKKGKKVQFILRSGVVSKTEESRRLQTAACRLTSFPKCAACQYGKQHGSHIPGTTPPFLLSSIHKLATSQRSFKSSSTIGLPLSPRPPTTYQTLTMSTGNVCSETLYISTTSMTRMKKG